MSSSSRLFHSSEALDPKAINVRLLGAEIDNLANAVSQQTARLLSPLSLNSLAGKRCWVAWREEESAPVRVKDGPERPRPRKVPYDPRTLCKARSNDPSTWGSRRESERAARTLLLGEYVGGVGIQLGLLPEYSGLALCGLDLDSCRDAETDAIEPWAAEILRRFQSRTEISPGLLGLKVFFLLSAENWQIIKHRASGKARVFWSHGNHRELALDLWGRYYTVTDALYGSQPQELRIVDLCELTWLVETAGPAFDRLAKPLSPDRSSRKLTKDESGSGHGFRYLLSQARERCTENEAIARLLADAGHAGDWARRTDDRQHERAWKRALTLADEEAQQLAAVFDDDDELESNARLVNPVVAKLNERHALVVVKGKSLITTEKDDGSIDFGTIRDLDALYANQLVPTGDGKSEPASRRWFKSPSRRTYANGVGIYFDRAPPKTFNLWLGWAVESDSKGSCGKFLWHLRHIICAGDNDQYTYLLGWLAHMVQFPADKPGVALVVRGIKGSGKDTVGEYVAELIAHRHAPNVTQMSHITGRFNARLEAALFFHIQEGVWAGNREAESVLKYLITSEQVEIERKGVDSYGLRSFLRMFISANEDWVVPASPDERRFAVFEVDDGKKGDGSYFRALRQEMEGEGPAALLHLLQTHDLAHFDVRQPPLSVGLRKQKLESLRGFDRWWFEKLYDGELGDDTVAWNEAPVSMPCQELRSDYEIWIAKHRYEGDPINPSQFGEKVHKFIPGLEIIRPIINGSRPRSYTIPVLEACREKFSREMGGHVFDWGPL